MVPTEKGPAFFRLFKLIFRSFESLSVVTDGRTDRQTDTLKGCRLSNLPVERIKGGQFTKQEGGTVTEVDSSPDSPESRLQRPLAIFVQNHNHNNLMTRTVKLSQPPFEESPSKDTKKSVVLNLSCMLSELSSRSSNQRCM